MALVTHMPAGNVGVALVSRVPELHSRSRKGFTGGDAVLSSPPCFKPGQHPGQYPAPSAIPLVVWAG